MKRIWIAILSFVMIIVGGMPLTNTFLNSYSKTLVEAEDVGEDSSGEDNSGELEGDNNSGEQEDYEKVGDAATLISKLKSSANIKLTADIKGVEVEEGGKITYQPIEINVADFAKFTGKLDGQGHTIKNIKLTYSTSGVTPAAAGAVHTTPYLAFIPEAKNAIIKDIKLEGSLEYDLSKVSNNSGVVAGIVGYGENVTIENCQLNITEVKGLGSIDKPITFGGIAGQLYGGKIQNCASYIDGQLTLAAAENFAFGGIVGHANQTKIINCISGGTIELRTSENLSENEYNTQYLGGIAGKFVGTASEMINCIYGGIIEHSVFSTVQAGAIIGGCPDTINAAKVHNNYYTQSQIQPVGDSTIASNDTLQNLKNINSAYTTINQTVLQDSSLFDQSGLKWDFDKTWDYREGKIVLQKFEKFTFSIPLTNFELETVGFKVLESAVLDENKKTNSYDYGAKIIMTITIKNDFNGWFENLIVYRNSVQIYEVVGQPDTTTKSWTYTIDGANASTAGTYTFSIGKEIMYTCPIETENYEHGGIKIAGASASLNKLNLNFSYSYNIENITAEAYGTYSFNGWKVYYWNETDKDYTIDASLYGLSTSSLPIKFSIGEEANTEGNQLTCGQRFKLVATFTNSPAKIQYKLDDNILGITFNGEEYVDEETPFNVPQTARSVLLKITVKKGYEFDVESLKTTLISLCTEDFANPYEIPQSFYVNDPVLDGDGNTVYTYGIDMSKFVYTGPEGTKDTFALELKSIKAEGSDTGNLTWLWITLPIVGVLAIGAVILVVVLKRKKGGRGGKAGKSASKSQEKSKSASYKDYFI